MKGGVGRQHPTAGHGSSTVTSEDTLGRPERPSTTGGTLSTRRLPLHCQLEYPALRSSGLFCQRLRLVLGTTSRLVAE